MGEDPSSTWFAPNIASDYELLSVPLLLFYSWLCKKKKDELFEGLKLENSFTSINVCSQRVFKIANDKHFKFY